MEKGECISLSELQHIFETFLKQVKFLSIVFKLILSFVRSPVLMTVIEPSKFEI